MNKRIAKKKTSRTKKSAVKARIVKTHLLKMKTPLSQVRIIAREGTKRVVRSDKDKSFDLDEVIRLSKVYNVDTSSWKLSELFNGVFNPFHIRNIFLNQVLNVEKKAVADVLLRSLTDKSLTSYNKKSLEIFSSANQDHIENPTIGLQAVLDDGFWVEPKFQLSTKDKLPSLWLRSKEPIVVKTPKNYYGYLSEGYTTDNLGFAAICVSMSTRWLTSIWAAGDNYKINVRQHEWGYGAYWHPHIYGHGVYCGGDVGGYLEKFKMDRNLLGTCRKLQELIFGIRCDPTHLNILRKITDPSHAAFTEVTPYLGSLQTNQGL